MEKLMTAEEILIEKTFFDKEDRAVIVEAMRSYAGQEVRKHLGIVAKADTDELSYTAICEKYNRLAAVHGDCEAKYKEAIESKWIKVEDRLPEDMQKVLFIIGKREIRKGLYYKSDPFKRDSMFYGELGYFEQDRITHWQPLPTAPD